MNLLGSIKNKLTSQINDTNFSGAIDVIVIQNEDGWLSSTPFYCKFGKVALSKPFAELTVDIVINEKLTSTFRMAFPESGESSYVENSFKPIQEEKKLINDEIIHSRSDSTIDDYLKAAKALENAINNSDTKSIESSSSEPFFYIELNDYETLVEPKASKNSADETGTVALKKYYVEMKTKNNSKLFELTSDQLKNLKLKQGKHYFFVAVSYFFNKLNI